MEATQSPPATASMEEIVVTGEYPGPGMWKVTRPEVSPGHTLYIVGAHPPLPKRMKWKSRDVEAVVLRAQEILLDAGVNMKPDKEIGMFRGLTLLPAALKARKNPGETTLREQLPPELYARWLTQKKRFLGSDRGVEEWRPLFAANKLHKEAVDDLGLRESGMVWDVVGKLARKHKIKVNSPSLKFTFPTADIKSKIKEFQREKLADAECLAVTLDLTEALSDSALQARRANAWATADIREQLYALWLENAEKSIAANETTLAIIPLDKLLREGGYLAKLRERGYEVEAPQ
jgi:TraB/PrgY/gumN family